MKRILITGADSYIGTSLERWVTQEAFQKQYQVDTLDMRREDWKEFNFSGYDSVFHVAGIAHSDISKVSDETKKRYYEINTELPVETANKAKEAGVGQFIFMSSMIVYGDSSSYGLECKITKDTVPCPANFYGDSKLQADRKLQAMNQEGFHVVSLRPPMIYGKGSRGNYPRLSKLAKRLPCFPDVKNQRSMLHIDNLCECIRLLIDRQESGIFFPQNREYVCTSELVKEIRKVHGKRTCLVRFLHPLVRLAGKYNGMVNKVFGSMVYEKEMSNYMDFAYCVNDFKESIQKTER